jgi:hypothetical protein
VVFWQEGQEKNRKKAELDGIRQKQPEKSRSSEKIPLFRLIPLSYV